MFSSVAFLPLEVSQSSFARSPPRPTDPLTEGPTFSDDDSPLQAANSLRLLTAEWLLSPTVEDSYPLSLTKRFFFSAPAFAPAFAQAIRVQSVQPFGFRALRTKGKVGEGETETHISSTRPGPQVAGLRTPLRCSLGVRQAWSCEKSR